MNARASHWLRRPRAASCAVALTVAACLTALVFRTPIRSRYWAWRVVHADSPTQRSVLIGALCAAGDGGRWGTDVLLKHAAGEVRQYGVLVLQHVKTEWARARLLERLGDLDPDVQRLAAVGLAMHHDDAVIPALQSLYRTGDQSSAHAACWAFEYLGTQAAARGRRSQCAARAFMTCSLPVFARQRANLFGTSRCRDPSRRPDALRRPPR